MRSGSTCCCAVVVMSLISRSMAVRTHFLNLEVNLSAVRAFDNLAVNRRIQVDVLTEELLHIVTCAGCLINSFCCC